MRTVEEIRDYLNIGTANEVEDILIANAMEIEKKHETELASGDYGYGIEADFVSLPFILEDEDEVEDLKKIDQIGGVVLYKKIYRKEITSVKQIEAHLNDGINRTEEEHKKCVHWLTEFMIANDMSLNELDELCWEDSNWIFEQIFGK